MVRPHRVHEIGLHRVVQILVIVDWRKSGVIVARPPLPPLPLVLLLLCRGLWCHYLKRGNAQRPSARQVHQNAQARSLPSLTISMLDEAKNVKSLRKGEGLYIGSREEKTEAKKNTGGKGAGVPTFFPPTPAVVQPTPLFYISPASVAAAALSV